MTTELPQSHVDDAQQMEADGKVDLFEIIFASGATTYLKANNDVTWQGHTYAGWAIKLTGIAQSTDEEVARPHLQLLNPEGIFSKPILDGEFDRATLVRRRVLRNHLEANVNIAHTQSWLIWRVLSVQNPIVTFELRDFSDGQNFVVPARMFIPPEFPFVSLQ